jgi:transposase
MALSPELQALTNSQEIGRKEFNRVLKESKTLAKTQNREVKKISSKMILKQRLAQLYCLGHYSTKDIASILMVSTATIRKMLKDPDVLDMINKYQDEEKQIIDGRIKALRNKATDTILELLDSDDDSIRLQASKDILDRTGHKADNNTNINVNISYEQQLQNLIEGIDYTEVVIDD